MTKIMESFGIKEGEELEHPWLNKSVETAQKRVEERNYQMRRRTLEFDDVMNQQRGVIYSYRNEVMDSENPRKMIEEVIEEVIVKKVSAFLEVTGDQEADITGLLHWINTTFPIGMTQEKANITNRSLRENSTFLIETVKAMYEKKTTFELAEARISLERYVILNAIDRLWQEHLYAMDGLREAVYLRAYGQKDPLMEYKTEAYTIFIELMENIKEEILSNLFRSTTNLQAFETLLLNIPQKLIHPSPQEQTRSYTSPEQLPRREEPFALPIERDTPKIGRNDSCPCGSGRKFKFCCGKE
jgi:preprotein translocase subunit SecA